jgi:hypothetical protein
MAQILTQGSSAAAFGFDHAMRHRSHLGAMSPLDRFSLVPYQIDPERNEPFWHLVHGQAHIDFTDTLPSWWYLLHPRQWPNDGIGIPSRQPIVDTDLTNESKRNWWEFVNNQEHLAAEASTTNATLVWPFW